MASTLTTVDRISRVELNAPYQPEGRHADPEGAVAEPGAMEVNDLMRLIDETRLEPPWRREADRAADYYDGNQLTPEVLGQMEERGIPPLIVNMTQPIINAVLGMEAKTRTDWQVTAENDASEEVATVLDQQLNECERAAFADRAISDAYASQVKTGMGWVEVAREADPFRYRYRVTPIHRREIWWDWRSRQPDLSDARYLVRKRWFDTDVLTAHLPQFEELIRNVASRWDGFMATPLTTSQSWLELARSYDLERDCTLDESDWRDSERSRLMTYEIWYRVWVRGHVMRLPGGQVMEIDRGNQRHMEVIASGAVQPIPAVYPRMRQSIWIGPHRVIDRKSPLPHQSFPYVPFWGFREDLTGAPYGLIRAMMSPQDEINARRSKMLALLSSRRVIADDDAIAKTMNSWEDVAEEAGRSDTLIVLNSGRRNPNGFVLENNTDLSTQQFNVLQESKANMHEASGIFPQTMGNTPQAMSGYAINSLVDQSTQTLADINDNYRYSRRLVGEQLLSFIRADLVNPAEVVVGEGMSKRSIYINRPVFSEQLGATMVENSVPSAAVKVALSEVPSTQSYREQQFAQLSEMTKSLPPEIQALVMDFVIEATDMPQRKKIAERIRRAMGVPPPDAPDGVGVDPAMAQMQQQYEQKIAEIMQQAEQMAAENQQLKMDANNRAGELQLKAQAQESSEIQNLAKTGLDAEAKDREFSLKERELQLKERDMALKEQMAAAEAEAEDEDESEPEDKTKVSAKPKPKPTVSPQAIASAVAAALAPALREVASATKAVAAAEKEPPEKKQYRVIRDAQGKMTGVEVVG